MMKTAVIILKSETEAHRAKKFLMSRKIFCVVEKIASQRSVCGYGIRVYGDERRICRMLENAGIKCLDVVWEGAK